MLPNYTSVYHCQIVFKFNWLVLWYMFEVITVTYCTYCVWSLQVAELTRHVTQPHNPIDEFYIEHLPSLHLMS